MNVLILLSHQTSGWNWTEIGVIASLIINAFTVYKFYSSRRSQESLFFLKQIKSYFANAIEILNNAGNNNGKWHHAISLLKTACDLRMQLKGKVHKRIFLEEYINTATYPIGDILKNVDDYRFFYGKQSYHTKKDRELYSESTGKPFTRISPDALSFLNKFIIIANQVYSIDASNDSWQQKFKWLDRQLNKNEREFTEERTGDTTDYLMKARTYIEKFNKQFEEARTPAKEQKQQ